MPQLPHFRVQVATKKIIALNLDLRIFQVLNVSSQAGYPYQYNEAQLISKFECASQIQNKEITLVTEMSRS